MISQEAKLWCAVITQAITDATLPLDVKTKSERIERQRARDWFTSDDRNFRDACHRAGLEPDRVRSYVLPLIAKASAQDLPAPERKPAPGAGRSISTNANDRHIPQAQDRI
ncbi:hypothetical protein [Bradyrhizobium sp. DASA03120]|uniref:hypothetical protein n=1 Tax=Bradyrhizobium sp. SMVTL-02 TaxID=3395917 RepID=UPI003F6FBB91